MHDFCMFPNFCKYGSILHMHFNYGTVLNIPGFQVCQVSAYARVAQGSEYTSIWLNNVLWQSSECTWSTFLRVLNKLPVPNMVRLKI